MRYALLLSLIFCSVIVTGQTQSPGPWKNKSCAVVLTYDDALNVHLDNAIPLLDSLGLKGTFYLSAYFPGSKDRIGDWRKAAARGHELGNHTLFHPCIGNLPGREWVNPERAMEKYSRERLLDEIRMTNIFLEAIDGKKKRTFAYPCGDMALGDGSYVPDLKNDFVSARGVQGELTPFNKPDLYTIGSHMINGQSGDQLIALVKEAMKNKMLLVFLFHGVGGEHGLNVGLKEHRQLLQFLKAHENEIWIAPFIEVTDHMKAKGSQSK